MEKKPLSLRIDPGLLAKIDEARGDVPRTRWVVRACEQALAINGSRPLDRLPPKTAEVEAFLDARAPDPSSGVGKATRPVVPARRPLPLGVKSARELAMERQRKLNEGKS